MFRPTALVGRLQTGEPVGRQRFVPSGCTCGSTSDKVRHGSSVRILFLPYFANVTWLLLYVLSISSAKTLESAAQLRKRKNDIEELQRQAYRIAVNQEMLFEFMDGFRETTVFHSSRVWTLTQLEEINARRFGIKYRGTKMQHIFQSVGDYHLLLGACHQLLSGLRIVCLGVLLLFSRSTRNICDGICC